MFCRALPTEEYPELQPMKVLRLVTVPELKPALSPIYVLQEPVVLVYPAKLPINVFLSPTVFFLPAKLPIKVFGELVFTIPAL